MASIYCIMPCTCDFAHKSSRSVNTCKTRVNTHSSQGTGKQRKDSRQKRADYREDVEKSRADSAARCHESYMKDPEKSAAHSTARSRESYKRDPEKSHADSAAQSRESYIKDPEKSHPDSAAQSREDTIKSNP